MDALTYICLGFFLVLALLGSGFWFYFKKLNPKLQAKYEGLVAAAVAKSEAALQSLNLDPPTVEELDWLGLLLNRFWTSMRESDSPPHGPRTSAPAILSGRARGTFLKRSIACDNV